MNNQIFVYDELLLNDIRTKLNIEPIRERIAETSGKLYMVNQIPIMLLPNDITHTRNNRRVLGAIYTFTDASMQNILDIVDNYKCCSLSRINVKHPLDLTYRTLLQVYPIIFDNIHELANFRYKYLEPEQCWVYLGNVKHDKIQYCVKKNQHNKLSDGCYEKGLQNSLSRLKYI